MNNDEVIFADTGCAIAWIMQAFKFKKNQLLFHDFNNTAMGWALPAAIAGSLAKNKKKTIHILNENNFNHDDSILIIRIFLNKSKRILKLASEYQQNRSIELTISSAKPPIFWKDKEIIKQQINQWTPGNIKRLIYKLNEMELIIKKNINNSVNMISDFILEQAS